MFSLRRRAHLGLIASTVVTITPLFSGAMASASESSGGSIPADELGVGIFVDNAFGDRAFFDIALEAVEPLEEQGITVNTYEGRLDADAFVSILENAGEDNELVFVLGFEAIERDGRGRE